MKCRLPLYAIAAVALSAGLSACSTPTPAVDVANLTVASMNGLSSDVDRYVSTVNASRTHAAERLAGAAAQSAERRRRVETKAMVWRLSKNNEATAMLKELRADDGGQSTNVYAISAIRSEIAKQLDEDFGAASVDKSKLDEALKNTASISSRNSQATLKLLFDFVSKILTEAKFVEGEAAKILEEAKKFDPESLIRVPSGS